jgi:plasmid stabilization system protein ParE
MELVPPVQLSSRALRSLRAICSRIAEDNESAALRVETAILEACNLLAANPLIGSERPHETKLPVRFWPVSRYPNYLVVYLPETEPLQIVAIVHGRRELKLALNY